MAGNDYLTSESNLANIESQLANFRASDQRRDDFVRGVVLYLTDLETKHRNLLDELENEQEGRRAWQSKARTYQAELDRHTQNVNNQCFTLALIDGDGAVFQDAFVAAAAEGGSDAAHKLATEIKTHLQSVDSSLGHLPLMIQMYTNLDGLSKKLQACGVIKNVRDLYLFAQSFNMSQPFFSILDVGSGKERADHKLKETFRLFINNQQCRHIILAGICHDNGYIPNLNPYRHDAAVVGRISLLETLPGEPGYAALGFQSFKCPSIFRPEALPAKPVAPIQQAYPVAVAQAMAALQSTNLRSNGAAPQHRSHSPPNGTSSTVPIQPAVERTPSTSSGISLNHENDINSWATVGKSGLTQKNISIAPAPKKHRPCIILNKTHERLDPPINRARADFNSLQERIKANGKVCNYYHLTGRCTDAFCEYKHAPTISESEKLALRLKARQMSCYNMGKCRDPGCVGGHNCPYGQNCNFDEECFFAATHGMDRTPAFKQYEDGTLEQFRSYTE